MTKCLNILGGTTKFALFLFQKFASGFLFVFVAFDCFPLTQAMIKSETKTHLKLWLWLCGLVCGELVLRVCAL